MGKLIYFIFKIIISVLSIFFILSSIAVFRAIILFNDPVSEPCLSTDKDFIPNSNGLSERLSKAITWDTISYKRHSSSSVALKNLQKYLEGAFPTINSSTLVKREYVNNFSILYHVQGSNDALKPYLLAGHLDVVPVEESFWEEPPFSGNIKDGFIWGRGTIDCKHIVMGILEALEFLLVNGYKPVRSFYVAFGHDEEIGGHEGAKQIGELLKSRNIELEYVLDEGSFVIDDFIPGIKQPIGFVSVTEKGSLDLELKVQATPGHSSFPGKETAIVILSKAISKLEGDVFSSKFGKVEAQMFDQLAYCVSDNFCQFSI